MRPYTFFDGKFPTTSPEDAVFYEIGEYETSGGSFEIRYLPGEGDRNWNPMAYSETLLGKTREFLDDHMSSRPTDPFFAYLSLGSVHEAK